MPDCTFDDDPALDLWLRWRRGERPDVRAILPSQGGLRTSVSPLDTSVRQPAVALTGRQP
jgi:hypothetical protein